MPPDAPNLMSLSRTCQHMRRFFLEEYAWKELTVRLQSHVDLIGYGRFMQQVRNLGSLKTVDFKIRNRLEAYSVHSVGRVVHSVRELFLSISRQDHPMDVSRMIYDLQVSFPNVKYFGLLSSVRITASVVIPQNPWCLDQLKLNLDELESDSLLALIAGYTQQLGVLALFSHHVNGPVTNQYKHFLTNLRLYDLKQIVSFGDLPLLTSLSLSFRADYTLRLTDASVFPRSLTELALRVSKAEFSEDVKFEQIRSLSISPQYSLSDTPYQMHWR